MTNCSPAIWQNNFAISAVLSFLLSRARARGAPPFQLTAKRITGVRRLGKERTRTVDGQRLVGVGEPANATAQIPRSRTPPAADPAWRVAAVNEASISSPSPSPWTRCPSSGFTVALGGSPLLLRRRLPMPLRPAFLVARPPPRSRSGALARITHALYSSRADAAPAMRGCTYARERCSCRRATPRVF